MNVSKPQDRDASGIQFGVEMETLIPSGAGIDIGGYHRGLAVSAGTTPDGRTLTAPNFRRAYWRAEQDSSIHSGGGYRACEFVSPVLCGDLGVAKLREMIAFIRALGGRVNDSCGCHITVGVESLLPAKNFDIYADFCRRLAHIAQNNAWAIYAQTGTGRHFNSYSSQLAAETEELMRQLVSVSNDGKQAVVHRCRRKSMINFQKLFSVGVIEFRAFAGTLDENIILHHLATVLGLMRRAATVQQFGRFDRKQTKKHSKIASAEAALRRMWRLLGWVDSVPGRDCALGLFGALHAEFGSYRKVALKMARQFEAQFPAANL
ncbi:MAG TPA: amidoligase family protein [Verrucomicrobiae bacterium]|nr:amidoligase family protein [Verrucomicrobiae bacterium]